MPETTPPSPDDPFAELFGKLPDPRARAASPGSDPGGDSRPTSEAPLSRRAAREAAGAAAPESAAETPTAPDVATPPVSTAGQYRASAAPVPPASDEPETSEPPARPYARSGNTPPHGTPAVAAAPADAAAAADRATAATAEPTAAVAAGAAVGSADFASIFAAEEPARSPARPAPTGSLDDLFTGATSTDDIGAPPPPKNKRKRRIGGWIAFGVVLVLFGGIAAGGLYVWTTYESQIREFMGWEEPKDFEEGLANGEALLTIVSGDNGQTISQSLFDAGVTKTPEAFYEYLIDEGQNPPFVPGLFRLQREMTSAAALEAILNPANKLENQAQLREGLTLEESLVVLSESLSIPLEDFQAAVADPLAVGVSPDPAVVAAGGQPLEGWLYPATYTFDPGVTATDVIGRLVTQTQTVLGNLGVPEEDRQRVLTIASIIQREARYEVDMQKVSRVIQNRLDPAISDTNGLLQMDSTAQFGYGEMHDGTVSSSGEALRDPNPWNTYVNVGLPVGPIANPGEVAIAAAMSPAEGDWQYFVTVNLATGETIFTSNLADHNRAVAQWQQWCRDNPDGGC
ncbi:endolytic transglycosylase MltG [Microbacterium sp. RU33B]|uniref:endolytic transglycosylase MltG n=1 Tax=Microbacterium sp. RU33B TaxID=1907390 RepID=UPI00095A7473|nr:endolytic transglycosylase MltG [Microbacterium sp. RU33B]SIT75134.1 UPF0755 protein [Microbacterium sp. RU33B]